MPLSDAAGSRMSNCTTTKLWQHLQETHSSNWGTLRWVSPAGSSPLQMEAVEQREPAKGDKRLLLPGYRPVAYDFSAAAQLKALQVRRVIS